jgi:hypothetical protein
MTMTMRARMRKASLLVDRVLKKYEKAQVVDDDEGGEDGRVE